MRFDDDSPLPIHTRVGIEDAMRDMHGKRWPALSQAFLARGTDGRLPESARSQRDSTCILRQLRSRRPV